MAIINGTAAGIDDTLRGTSGDDSISGLSGDDMLIGGRGDDILVGGQGSDVMAGGLDSDTFVWSAGHVGNGATDYVIDFSLNQGDALSFLNSGGGQSIEVLSVARSYRTETEFNGNDLRNNVDTGTDVTFTIRNSVTGATQEIVLLDSWSGELAQAWNDYLTSMGLSWA
jgi:Ca2+-binding RTX toxin-like protein